MTVLATKHLTLVDLMKQTVGESIESDIAEIKAYTVNSKAINTNNTIIVIITGIKHLHHVI